MMWIASAGKELYRKKIMPVAAILTLLYVGLFNFGLFKMLEQLKTRVHFPFENVMEVAAMLSLGLIFAGMMIAFLVFFVTMGAISGEVESGLMLAVLARPIPRWKVYVGKYVGMAFWIVLYSTLLYMAIVFPVHYMSGLPLSAASLLRSWLLFVWGPMLLLAISMLGSTYLPMLGNGVACGILYGLSLFTGFAEALFSMNGGNANLSTISLLVSLVMPSSAISSRLTYEIIGSLDIPILPNMTGMLGPLYPVNVPSSAYIGYTGVFYIALLVWGCWAFTRKDIS